VKSGTLIQNKSSTWIALGVLFAIIIIGLSLINKLSDIEYERDIQNWQHRLSLMVDVREEQLNNWISAQYDTLQTLADNQSLQLYLSQISGKTNNNNTEIQTAQRTYLRNLLLNTATNSGFSQSGPTSPIKANIPIVQHSGIAIVHANGDVIITTPNMPLLDKLSIEKAKETAKNGTKSIRDIYINEHAEHVAVFIVPVRSSISSSGKTNTAIVGMRTLGKSIYPLLKKQIFSTNSDDTILIRREQGSVVYLNKENTNNRNIFIRLPRDPDSLAASFALDYPGAFGERKNYLGQDILFVSRQIKETNWLLLQTISSEEALKESKAHQQSLVTSFSYGLAALVFIILASWRHGASLHAQEYAKKLEEKSSLLSQQRKVLYSITNNLGDLILIVDSNSHIKFSNQPLASLYNLKPADLVGKTLTATLGSEAGKLIEQYLLNVRNTGSANISVNTFSFNDETKIYHSSFLPIGNNNILIVLHDITELKQAEGRNKRLMTNLVHTLTHIIDSYVPDSASHSAKTTKIASAIGKELNLSNSDIETLELAACLANIGKIFIPRDILLKTGALSDEEKEILQSTANQASSMLVDLEFDGPVLETIAQKNERMDGSGYPGKLPGERILMTARILAVANAFVAMHSPRAYRDSLSTRESLQQLYDDSGTLYDEQVVAALIHVVENKLDDI